MDIHKINRALDLFMKRMYDVDAYFTKQNTSLRNEPYRINILFFPSKFLKNSPDYSEKYFKFFNRPQPEIEKDVERALRYLGIDTSKYMTDNILFDVSSTTSEYLQNYTSEFISNVNNFIESKGYSEVTNLDDYVSNVTLDRMEILIPYSDLNDYPSNINLRLNFDSTSEFFINPLLNDDSFRNELLEYLDNHMELDPQIDFWFE